MGIEDLFSVGNSYASTTSVLSGNVRTDFSMQKLICVKQSQGYKVGLSIATKAPPRDERTRISSF